MDENTNTTKTEPVVDAGLKQRTLTTAQAMLTQAQGDNQAAQAVNNLRGR